MHHLDAYFSYVLCHFRHWILHWAAHPLVLFMLCLAGDGMFFYCICSLSTLMYVSKLLDFLRMIYSAMVFT